jgi:2-polyprenyl-3-methyl-5-hydroxy-6-metoxy-1,4-benzoquinol methylase
MTMESKTLPDAVDPRMCGLMDAVLGGWFQRDSNELFEGFPVSADDTVLDFGCGGGGAALFCGRTGAHIYIADTLEERLSAVERSLRDTAARGVHTLLMTSDVIDLDDSTMSRVIAMEVLEHTLDPAAILAELVRVAKPGALFLLTVPDARGEELQRHVAPEEYFSAPNHIQVFTGESFTGLVAGAGLQIERHFNQGFYWLLWLCFNWITRKEEGQALSGMAQDSINPPYSELSRLWSTTWHRLLSTEGGPELKKVLDQTLPFGQGIIARKP